MSSIRIISNRVLPLVILASCVAVFAFGFPSLAAAQSKPANEGGAKAAAGAGGESAPSGGEKPPVSGTADETGSDKASAVTAPGVRPPQPIHHVPTTIPLRDRALDPKCAWMGERVVSLLVRDDAEMAERFLAFYTRFECPAPRIGDVFACVIRSPVAGSTGDNGGLSLASVTSACWTDPTLAFPLPRENEPVATPAKK